MLLLWRVDSFPFLTKHVCSGRHNGEGEKCTCRLIGAWYQLMLQIRGPEHLKHHRIPCLRCMLSCRPHLRDGSRPDYIPGCRVPVLSCLLVILVLSLSSLHPQNPDFSLQTSLPNFTLLLDLSIDEIFYINHPGVLSLL